jgi:hypothetical protein
MDGSIGRGVPFFERAHGLVEALPHAVPDFDHEIHPCVRQPTAHKFQLTDRRDSARTTEFFFTIDDYNDAGPESKGERRGSLR